MDYFARRDENTNQLVTDSNTIRAELRYFDNNGNLVSDTLAGIYDTVYAISQYKYASPGQLIEEASYHGDVLNDKSSYEYDENGFIIKETAYDPEENRAQKSHSVNINLLMPIITAINI